MMPMNQSVPVLWTAAHLQDRSFHAQTGRMMTVMVILIAMIQTVPVILHVLLADVITIMSVNPERTATTALMTVPEYKKVNHRTDIAAVMELLSLPKVMAQFVMAIFNY